MFAVIKVEEGDLAKNVNYSEGGDAWLVRQVSKACCFYHGFVCVCVV